MNNYRKKFLEISSNLKDKKLQPLKNIFNEDINYGLDVLNFKNFIEQKDKFKTVDSLIDRLYQDKIKIENQSININNIDYLLKKYLSFLSKNGDISYYEELKKEVLFSDKNVKEYFLIAGDFFGIQKFIFSNIESKFASKILRAKSAYIQIFIKIIAQYIVDRLSIDALHIITSNAGKFEILSPIVDEKLLKDIQSEIDSFFIKEYFGESGVGISWIKCKRDEFNNIKKYKILRERVSNNVEAQKFKRFNLQSINPVMEYDDNIDNQNLCRFCHKKKGKKRIDKNDKDEKYIACDNCEQFIEIGKNLTTKRYIIFTKDRNIGVPIFKNYSIHFDVELISEDKPAISIDDFLIFDISNEDRYNGFAKWELSSYVKNNKKGKIYTFNDLAKCSCNKCEDVNREKGIEAIISLKGDVDGMGNFIKNSSVTDTFTKFNFFSRIVDYFFSVYVSNIMVKDYPNTYTIFAGGDDIFLIGAWDRVIDLAKKIRYNFKRFIQERDDLSISIGLILTKPNRPINYIADISEKALEDAKNFYCIKKEYGYEEIVDKDNKSKEDICKNLKYCEKKDAITLFGETAKWDNYLNIYNELYNRLEEFDENYMKLNTTFLYRLLYFIEMSKKVKYNNDIPSTMWISKLRYSFNRNIFEKIKDKNRDKALELLKCLDKTIRENPKESKMVLFEFIYKRRDR